MLEPPLSLPTWQVRRANLDDLSQVVSLITTSFALIPHGFEWWLPILRLGIYEDLRQRCQAGSKSYLCLVATALGSEQIVGTAEVSLRSPWFWQQFPQRYAYLANLAVHPNERRQGVARRLLQASEAQVIRWQCDRLFLHVMENNQPAVSLYQQMGYEICRAEWDLMHQFFSQPQRLLLQKQLTPKIQQE
ncbi:MAG: GNAT family N-acetyltransferase [Synechococcales bacterium]|nr:GNAT family N-acetyltransferase [Synechococcales bacterium]